METIYVRKNILSNLSDYLKENVGVFLGMLVTSYIAFSLLILLSAYIGYLTYWGIESVLMNFDIYRVFEFFLQTKSIYRFFLLYIVVFGLPFIVSIAYSIVDNLPLVGLKIARAISRVKAKFIKPKKPTNLDSSKYTNVQRYINELSSFTFVSILILLLLTKVAQKLGGNIAHDQDKSLVFTTILEYQNQSVHGARILYADEKRLLYQKEGVDEVFIVKADGVTKYSIPHDLQAEIQNRLVPGTTTIKR